MRSLYAVCLLSLLTLSGCDGEPSPRTVPGPLPPLSLEEWKQLPEQEKYDEATFDRLREQDKSLQSERGWGKFMREVVVPERKKDGLPAPGQPAG
ncbi:MAG: hypothetical protein HYV60_10035 [Planctomycetia bacterium]|nr:hypothetical protein [Planctomycetia bacterium]